MDAVVGFISIPYFMFREFAKKNGSVKKKPLHDILAFINKQLVV